MNKRLLKATAVSVCTACAVASAALLTACGNKKGGAQSYYDKTITFTGNDFHRGFEEGGVIDNYGSLGSTTYKKIIETYWDDIDFSRLDNPPTDVDGFKTMIENFHPYQTWAGLSFTVTKADTVTITVNMPSSFASWGWGTSVTMPLYESEEALSAAYSDVYTMGELRKGYYGTGVKVDGNKMLRVDVIMGYDYNKNKDDVTFIMSSQTKEGEQYNYDKGIGQDMTLTLNSKPVDMGNGGFLSNSVLYVHYIPEVIITNN